MATGHVTGCASQCAEVIGSLPPSSHDWQKHSVETQGLPEAQTGEEGVVESEELEWRLSGKTEGKTRLEASEYRSV